MGKKTTILIIFLLMGCTKPAVNTGKLFYSENSAQNVSGTLDFTEDLMILRGGTKRLRKVNYLLSGNRRFSKDNGTIVIVDNLLALSPTGKNTLKAVIKPAFSSVEIQFVQESSLNRLLTDLMGFVHVIPVMKIDDLKAGYTWEKIVEKKSRVKNEILEIILKVKYSVIEILAKNNRKIIKINAIITYSSPDATGENKKNLQVIGKGSLNMQFNTLKGNWSSISGQFIEGWIGSFKDADGNTYTAGLRRELKLTLDYTPGK
ncbi:hypothetical protein KKF34_15710 [Myxococcota bacterium]|nr:hypothetical protein [Myxococcota bacterium]MBU1382210.1 hypothetical protein [Myxococcota bacterium]MBU1498322.1 hypothetical protein [Myxococcota bacterium]